MSILDETGQGPSITEGGRALELFTDRHTLIRAFVETLHAETPPERILFFTGGGGNGKTLLLRFLHATCCKHFRYWSHIRSFPDADMAARLRRAEEVKPLPKALLDFNASPREFEQPKVAYDALLMLRRDLAPFGLQFPLYDFASLWYLHKTGRLTQERLKSLFPNEEADLVAALADALGSTTWGALTKAVFGIFDKHLQERWTLYRSRRQVDEATLESFLRMQDKDTLERELVPKLPSLFAKDLGVAMQAEEAPPRLVLLFDGHEAFWRKQERSSDDLGARQGDTWLRYLLASLDLKAGIVPVVAGREPPRWAEATRYSIPAQYLDVREVGHFTDADADAYLAGAGVDDAAMRARLLDYARVEPDEVHPLYAGLAADVVLQAKARGHRLRPEEFPELPDTGQKRRALVDRLLYWAEDEVEDAVRALSACRAFDRELYFALGERLRFHSTKAGFDALTGFSFVWTDDARGSGWYRIHDLLRRILRERGDDRVQEADEALEGIYCARAQEGDPLALAEVVYHAYQQEDEHGLKEWGQAFEQARRQSAYALCDALLDVRATFAPVSTWWQARLAQEKGDYFLVRSLHLEAREAFEEAMEAYQATLQEEPDDAGIYNNKGIVLQSLGELLARLSRHEEAQEHYERAVEALDEALRLAPSLSQAHNNKGSVLQSLGDFLAGLSRHAEARQSYERAVEALDEALRLAPEDPEVYNNKGIVLQGLGQLLARLSRHEEAQEHYERAVEAYDEALRLAPEYIDAHSNKGNVLQRLGDFLARLSRHEEARQSYEQAVEAYDEVLRLAPEYIVACRNKAFLQTRRSVLHLTLEETDQGFALLEDAAHLLTRLLQIAPRDQRAQKLLEQVNSSLDSLRNGPAG